MLESSSAAAQDGWSGASAIISDEEEDFQMANFTGNLNITLPLPPLDDVAFATEMVATSTLSHDVLISIFDMFRRLLG